MGSLSAHARPTYRPETSQLWLGKMPNPGGLPMFFLSSSVTPLQMGEKGDLRSGGFGPEGSAGLPARTPGARTKAQVFEPRGGRGLLIAGCNGPAGSRKGVGTPRATQGTGPLESSMGNPPPMPRVPKSVLSTLSVRG